MNKGMMKKFGEALAAVASVTEFEITFSPKAKSAMVTVTGGGSMTGYTESGLELPVHDQAGVLGEKTISMTAINPSTGEGRISRIRFYSDTGGEFSNLNLTF